MIDFIDIYIRHRSYVRCDSSTPQATQRHLLATFLVFCKYILVGEVGVEPTMLERATFTDLLLSQKVLVTAGLEPATSTELPEAISQLNIRYHMVPTRGLEPPNFRF